MNKIYKKIAMSVTLAIAALSFIGCSSSSGGGSAPTKSTKSKVSITVEDAHAGLINQEVSLTFAGLEVYDVSDQRVSTLVIAEDKGKQAEVFIKNPPEQSVALKIISSVEGYIDSGSSVLVRPIVRDYGIKLKLVKDGVGKMATGIYSNRSDISAFVDSTGKVTSEIRLETNSIGKPNTVITIPVGTVLKDKDGNPVVDGELSITGFDPNSPKALAAYPGGLSVIANATGFTKDGTVVSGQEEINFKSAGFAAISITGGDGKKVSSFSQDVEVAMQFPVGTTDGDGQIVAAGDSVPIWSYDEYTGEWSYEKEGIAQVNTVDNTLLDVVYKINHLSYYNLDWHYGPVCAVNINVIDSVSTNQLALVDYFTVSIPGANLFRTVYPWGSASTGNMVLNNVPSGFSDGVVTAFDSSGAILGTAGPLDLCAGLQTSTSSSNWSNENFDNEVDLIIGNLNTVPVTTTFSCPNGANVPGYNSPSVPFQACFTEAPGGGATSCLNSSGTGTLGILSGSIVTYDVSANGVQQSLFNNIDASNVNNPVGNQVSISGSSSTFNQDFVLTNAFCSATGTIDGIACGAIGTATSSTVGNPMDVVEASNGDLYISTRDRGILKVSGGGVPATYIDSSINSSNPLPTFAQIPVSGVSTNSPQGMDLYSSNGTDYLVYADAGADCVNLVDLSSNTVVAIAGTCGMFGDTSSTYTSQVLSPLALLNNPTDVAYDANNQTLYIADAGNRKIKAVTSSGVIWTIAGTGAAPSSDFTDGDLALATNLNPIQGLDVDSHGDVVFSQEASHRVSRIMGIDPYATSGNPGLTAKLFHVAGTYNSPGFSGDSGTATSAQLNRPMDIEIDASDNILIADFMNHRVRKVWATSGLIETVAGTGVYSGANVCGIATSQNIAYPRGLWYEPNADFYLTQTIQSMANALVRHVTY